MTKKEIAKLNDQIEAIYAMAYLYVDTHAIPLIEKLPPDERPKTCRRIFELMSQLTHDLNEKENKKSPQ